MASSLRCLIAGLLLVAPPTAPAHPIVPRPPLVAPRTRVYYIAADPVAWDYVPGGRDDIAGVPYADSAFFAKAKPRAVSTIVRAMRARSAPASPCDVITAADVASILIAPATRMPGVDSVSCMYQTHTHATVRIGVARGDDEKGAWMLATTYNATKTPLTGVGDEALYNPDGTTLIAREGDTSCRVDVVGYDNATAMDDITTDRGAALARKLGALCKTLLASH